MLLPSISVYAAPVTFSMLPSWFLVASVVSFSPFVFIAIIERSVFLSVIIFTSGTSGLYNCISVSTGVFSVHCNKIINKTIYSLYIELTLTLKTQNQN